MTFFPRECAVVMVDAGVSKRSISMMPAEMEGRLEGGMTELSWISQVEETGGFQ